MKQKTAQKPYWEMTSDELAEATKEFDRAIPLSKTKPLTKAQRANFERMRHSPHRSVYVSRNGDRVLVRLDPELLRRSSRYAAEQNLTLSEVINRSLKGMLAIVETAPGAPRRESKRKKAS